MPLDRQNVTPAVWILMPTFVVLFTALGLNYLLAPRQRLLESPALQYADQTGNLRVWALMFLATAALMGYALAIRERGLFRYALYVSMISMSVWAVLFGLSAIFAAASPTTFAWPAFAAVVAYAVNRSLRLGVDIQ